MGRYRNVTILAAAIFVQILGLAVQVKRSTDNQSSRLIRVWTVSAITPFEKSIVRIQDGISDVWHNYFYLRGVRQENRQLKEQIEQLQLEQVRLQQDANQAHRLQSLLGFKEQFIAKTLAAQVIGSSGSDQSRTVYLDKGSRDGVKQEMPVISSTGVVGKVSAVYRTTSEVLLINDQESGIGAILEQSRLQGVLKGKASGELVMDKVMSDEDVKLGDKAMTSGGDLIFPKGLVIGTVAKITKGPEFLEVSIKPAAALNRLEEVLVITQKEEREPISPAAPTRAADILAQRLPSVPDKPPASANASSTHGRNSVALHPAAQATGILNSPATKQAAATTTSSPKSATPGLANGNPPNGNAPVLKPAAEPAAGLSKPLTDAPQPQPDTSGDGPQ